MSSVAAGDEQGAKNSWDQLKQTTCKIPEIDQARDIKSLICPLCFRFINRCQMTVCGHSFCSKCIDEYLIIKKQCFVCQRTIRTAKATYLLPCFSVDDVISQIIAKQKDSDIQVEWE
mmetsp:Transcript_17446/g.26880  ORF Transcript_17446/g.26880 Transcript_17446/m.26880 type:complete len:117 (+) Transcript_17446:1092-1442(+)